MSHLKSTAAPKSWIFLKKEHTFVTRPQPGAHPLRRSLPITLLLKQLGVARTTREVKRIINDRNVHVDGVAVKDHHYGVGFMDIITIGDKHVRCTLDTKGRLTFNDITKAEAGKKLCKIVGKTTVRGGKNQLNLLDGRNILVEKGAHKPGDSIILTVPKQSITDHFPLAKGNTAFLLGGRHTGAAGTIDKVDGNKVWVKTDKQTFETLKKFILVTGKGKPALKL